MERPHVILIQTALGYYFYEVGKNQIVSISRELYLAISRSIDEGKVPECISEKTKAEYLLLQECGYLQPNRLKNVEHPISSQVPCLLDRKIEKITLQVTQSCNLRCSYCIYAEDKNLGQRSHSSNSMSLDTAKRAIDFYRSHSEDAPAENIGFYGGEPLLQFPLIQEIVNYAETVFSGKKLSFIITTNATLLTDEVIKFLISKNFKVMFSIDGSKDAQDKNRRFSNGTGSYDIVIKNINRFFEIEPELMNSFSVSTVITPDQNYEDVVSLFSLPSLKQVNIEATYVEEDAVILHPSVEYISKYAQDYFYELVNQLRGSRSFVTNALVKKDVLSMINNTKQIRPITLGESSAPGGPCIPGKLRLFINCFGDFYPCERVNENCAMKIGSLDTGFNYEKVDELLNIGKINSESCRKCWAFSLCTLCAKQIDDGGVLSSEKKARACKESKEQAYSRLMNRILLFENERHMKQLGKERLL